MEYFDRNTYLEWFHRWKNIKIIKVITGVRRSGKSTLFKIFQEDLINHGVDSSQIIDVNFEDLSFEHLLSYHELYRYLSARIQPGRMTYLFLDEIQHVDFFQKAVDSLFLKDNVDIYITGSNAYLMSGELATLLTGRYVELHVMPLSFHEFCSGYEAVNRATETDVNLWNLYLSTGSFPFVLRNQMHPAEAQEYMRGIYNTVLLHDVVGRLKISDVSMLEDVARFLFSNIGSRTSPAAIAKYMTSNARKIDPKTVERYLRGLTDSLLFYEARRYNIKGRQVLKTSSKFYACDAAMRNMLVKGTASDIGHILENIVFLELKRRYSDVYVGQVNTSGEIDFVAIRNGRPEYYQVCTSALDDVVLERELKPLIGIGDNYPKYLLTLDSVFKDMDYDGIHKMNAIEWMRQEDSIPDHSVVLTLSGSNRGQSNDAGAEEFGQG